MYKRVIAIVFIITTLSLSLTGCGLLGLSIDFQNNTVPKSEPIYTMDFIDAQDSIASQLNWTLITVNGQDANTEENLSWDKLKIRKAKESDWIIGVGSDQYDGMEIFVGAEDVGLNETWGSILDKRIGQMIYTCTLNSESINTLFGKNISSVKDIESACGRESGILQGSIVYRLGFCDCVMTIEDDEDLGPVLLIAQIPSEN